MATKKSATELLDKYYHALIFSLPMKDAEFLDNLCQTSLIIEQFRHDLESFSVHKERVSYFLDHVISPGIKDGNNTNFIKLLTVMKNSGHDNVSDLAKLMEAECTMDVICKLMNMTALI